MTLPKTRLPFRNREIDGEERKKSIHERLQINKEIIAKKQGKDNKEKGVEITNE